MARRLQLRSSEQAWDLDGFSVLIGGCAEANVKLAKAGVAQKHAVVTRAAGEFFLEPLPTTDETLLNGARLYASAWHMLRAHDRLRIGPVELEVNVEGEPAPGTGLILVNGYQRGTAHSLRGEVVIGRALACDLRLDDEAAAEQHARIRWTAQGWLLAGLAPGLHVNGAVTAEHVLCHGDELRLGSTKLVFIDHHRSASRVAPVAASPRPSAPPARARREPIATAPPLPPSLVGRVVGRCALKRLLGLGGMGIVCEAQHVDSGELFAVKMLAESYAQNDEAVERFLREALLANDVEHAGIVQIFDCGTTDEGIPYLVMELLQGESLARRIGRHEKLSEAEVRRIGGDLADVLGAVHAAGIVHRDLKPDNIYCIGDEEQPTVKVLDLGIAKALRLEQLTRTGEIIGTAAYLAPEQCLAARSVGPRVDIYALGCILFEMVTGRPPFVGAVVDLMQQHFSVNPPAPSSLAPMSPELERIILKCLRKRPDARYASMAALQRDLGAPPAA